MKRAVVLVGAGASIDYKAPSTCALTKAVERNLRNDPWVKKEGGYAAFKMIKCRLKAYRKNVNFEDIYHCAHELFFAFPPTGGAVDEFRPVLFPFLKNNSRITQEALKSLVDKIVEVIFSEISSVCDNDNLCLDPLRNFIKVLKNEYSARIYSTNYDDFLLQAAPDLYTGFDLAPSATPKRFDRNGFWRKEDLHSLFHLHGSVHMGFAAPRLTSGEIDELFWFDDRIKALKYSSFTGSTRSRPDGSAFFPSAVITGLDKLSRLQQSPLCHFYTALARDLMLADVIFVIGSGLADLHLNTWIEQARLRVPKPPLLFVDLWPNGFKDDPFVDWDRKRKELFHRLQVQISEYMQGTRYGTGWTISEDHTAAIWDKGFKRFLNAPTEMRDVLSQLH